MNIPNIKDILQKLSVFKNNMSLLIPVIITVIAGLLFIPTQLMSSKLKKQVEQDSINKGKEIQRLIDSPVMQSKIESQHQEDHAKDADDVNNLSMQTTQRELLSYDIFPEPDPNNFTPLVFQQFGGRFREGLEDLIAKFNGNSCPTIAELQRRLENSAAFSRMGGRGGRDPMGSSRSSIGSSMESMRMPSLGGAGGRSLFNSRGGSMDGMGSSMMLGSNNELAQMIIDEVCLGRAKATSVYVDPIDLSGYGFWANYEYDVVTEDGIKDCWYYQLAYWVIEDIFDTIGSMNSAYENVLTAPVKRLEHVNFTTMGMIMAGRAVSMTGRGGSIGRGFNSSRLSEGGDRPEYLLSVNDGLTESYTARYSKEENGIDVIHFNFAVIIDVKSILPFMQELCSAKEHQFSGYPVGNESPQTFEHNQITVLEAKVISVNTEDGYHFLYRYGEDPVVELDLVCEYIFNRDGYKPIKPEPVKKTLRGEDEEDK
jgi:hypothetical protein